MMRRFFPLILASLLAGAPGTHAKEYTMSTYLNGTAIPDTEPEGATITLVANENGQLEFTATNVFFGRNSPAKDSLALGSCQQRPFDGGLYDFEVVKGS